VYLVIVLAPEETAPQMRGEFTLIDAESEIESGIVLDGSTLKRYRHALENFRQDWQEFCRATGTVLMEFSSAQEIGPDLFRALAEGGLIS
jgi:hypothetical protein